MQRILLPIVSMACALLLPAAPNAATPMFTTPSPNRWTPERAWNWHTNQPWLCGFNYVPANSISYTEMWMDYAFDPALIDRELALAQKTGFNCLRVVLPFVVWEAEPEAFKKRFAAFLAICEKRGLKVMPCFFDDCVFGPISDPVFGRQPAVAPGWYANGWTPSPGHKKVRDPNAYPALERYVKDILTAFAKDARILCWDLYNEPSNSGLGSASLPLLREVFRWAREVNPTQPITSGIWGGTAQVTAFLRSEPDIITFHNYRPEAELRREITELRALGRPLICTEWLNRPKGSLVETCLPVFQAERVGALHWGLVNGKTQTHLPWGHKPGDPEPAVWQHDLYHPDHRPYQAWELTLFERFIRDSKTQSAAIGLPSLVKLPGLRKLMDTPLRDTSICRGPDGMWYMTGTVQPFWAYNEGIKVWSSKDLTNWTALGWVWKYGESPWHKPYLEKKKPLWAPEIHYLKGTFWLTYSIPGWDGTGKTSGSGLLKSTSGKAEGPYMDMQPNERMGDEIDASLFQDDDGTVYFLWHSGKIARLKPDMSGLAEPYRWLKTTVPDPNPKHHSPLCAGIFGKDSFDHVGYEGMFLFKANGLYYLTCAEHFDSRYSCTVATATNLFGPYGARYEALPHGGHNTIFKDAQGRWWSSYFGSDGRAPWQERPGIFPIHFDTHGRLLPGPAE